MNRNTDKKIDLVSVNVVLKFLWYNLHFRLGNPKNSWLSCAFTTPFSFKLQRHRKVVYICHGHNDLYRGAQKMIPHGVWQALSPAKK